MCKGPVNGKGGGFRAVRHAESWREGLIDKYGDIFQRRGSSGWSDGNDRARDPFEC